jgi:hypothetical protein
MTKHGKDHGKLRYIFLLGFILSLAGVLLAQNTPNKVLMVNGKASGTVTQFGGHSYIDLETVAQITNGTLAVEPTRITLTIPEPTPAPAANPAPQPAPVAEGLSREFARAAISELAEIREWRGAIGTILTYGVAVVGTWPQDYRAHVETDLAQVAVNASTSADQSALQLLRNEFGFMEQWADEVVTARQSLNANKSVDPNAMQNDPTLAKVTSCGRFLNSMLVSGGFADDPSCH